MEKPLRVYDSILDLFSSEDNPTPLVRVNKLNPFRNVQLYAKLEWYNPFGTVKDRVALHMLLEAEKKGLTPDKKLLEPTSGNMGIGLAAVANLKGYRLMTPLASSASQEKKKILRLLGSEIEEYEETPLKDGGIRLAKEKLRKHPDKYHMLNQYANEANTEAHYMTTGPEIWKQTGGKLTHLIAGLGTCGTIRGAGRFLKEKNPDIKVIGVHPEENHRIPGVRSIRQLSATNFFNPDEYDGLVEVKTQEANELCLRLNREEGIIAGPSSAMALAGAFKALEDQPACAVIIFPDDISRYKLPDSGK